VAAIISTDDLPAELVAKVEASQLTLMVAGANAKASRVAPCLAGTGEDAPTEDQVAEAKLVLVGAVKRWSESGSGALSQQAAGPFSQTVDTRQRTGYNLWPSEIEQLQDICADGGKSGSAFSFSIGGGSSVHMPWCSLMLGAAYCSCGADLTNYEYPLYEGGVLTQGDDY
jgi:hypothetical protein